MNEFLTNPNVRTFLNFLGKSEGADYNTVVGGSKFSDFSAHPNQIGLVTSDGPSTAAGKYQITGTTYRDVAPKIGVADFSPESQDKVAVELIKRNNAMDNVLKGDFMGAVDKLGGVWASLPSSKYNQPKRSQAWVEQVLGRSAIGNDTVSMNNPRGITPNPNPVDLAAEAAIQKRDNGGLINGIKNLPEALSKGFVTNDLTYNYIQDKAISSIQGTPIEWSKEDTTQFLDGVPRDNWEYIMQAQSYEEAAKRKARVEDTIKSQQQLAKMGFTGFLGNTLGDVTGLAAMAIPIMGEEVGATKFANAIRMGLAAGTSNAIYEAVAHKYKPVSSVNDIYIAGLLGFGLGVGGGAFIDPARSALSAENKAIAKFAVRESKVAQVADLEAAGMKLTPKGQAAFGPISENPPKFLEVPRVSTASEALDHISKNTTIPEFKVLADKLGIHLDDSKVTFKDLAESPDLAAKGKGVTLFDQATGNAVIHLGEKGLNEQTVLHELTHAATMGKLDNLSIPAVKEIDDLRNFVASQIDMASNPKIAEALKDNHEFLTYGITDKAFQETLDKIMVTEKKSVLDTIIDKMASLFGLTTKKEVSALTKLLKAGDNVFDYAKPTNGSQFKMAAQTVGADALRADLKEATPYVFSDKGSAYENVLLSKNAPEEVRQVASKIFGTTQGYAGHEVVKPHASEDALNWTNASLANTRKSWLPEFDSWRKEQGYGFFDKGKAYVDFSEQMNNYIRGYDGDYSPQVIKSAQSFVKEFEKTLKRVNNPLVDSGGTKRGLASTEVKDPKTGKVTIEGEIPANPNYLPRRTDILKWQETVMLYGDRSKGLAQVEAWWAGARKAAWSDMTDAEAAKFGKFYVRVQEAAHANKTQDMLEDVVHANNPVALRSYITKEFGIGSKANLFSESEINDMVDALTYKGREKGTVNASFRHRNTIDEGYKEKWQLPDGSYKDISLNNFIDTDAISVGEAYFKRANGSVALAKHLDIYKLGDVDTVINDATHNELGKGFKSSAPLEKYRKYLREAIEDVQGVPRESWTWWRQTLKTLMGYEVISKMSGAVWNQTVEWGNVLGALGYKTTLQGVPEIKSFIRNSQTGVLPHEMLEHIENTIGGVGAEYITRVQYKPTDTWIRNMGDSKIGRFMDKADSTINKGAQAVLDWSGMTPMQILQERHFGVGLVNKFMDLAHKGDRSYLTVERMAHLGFSEADTANLVAAIKRHTKGETGEYFKKPKLDIDKFAAQEPAAHYQLMSAISRESRRVIQHNELASMIPVMGTTLGQMTFQFMNFSMQAWNKAMLYSMNHRDMTVLMSSIHGSYISMLAYVARTHVQAMGMDEEDRQAFLDKRLSAGQIAANSFGKLAVLSVLPNAYDSLPFTQPMFSGMRTTSDLSGIASLPLVQDVNAGLKISKTLTRKAISPDEVVTGKDIMAMKRLTPLNNAFPITMFWNGLANEFPKNSK
ncbi:MAG: hypothetical protein B7X60_00015 [Polynucleobacter sp. 39-45-136]|jgi:muramidase (phage lysozyme)|nr:MAG: hypothetical protein B7X60_00015 [Polynucleobacter sp. 39-45-136]